MFHVQQLSDSWMAGIKGCVISDRNYIFEGEIGLKKRKLKGKQMHIGMIAPISWRVPPRGYCDQMVEGYIRVYHGVRKKQSVRCLIFKTEIRRAHIVG